MRIIIIIIVKTCKREYIIADESNVCITHVLKSDRYNIQKHNLVYHCIPSSNDRGQSIFHSMSVWYAAIRVGRLELAAADS